MASLAAVRQGCGKCQFPPYANSLDPISQFLFVRNAHSMQARMCGFVHDDECQDFSAGPGIEYKAVIDFACPGGFPELRSAAWDNHYPDPRQIPRDPLVADWIEVSN